MFSLGRKFYNALFILEIMAEDNYERKDVFLNEERISGFFRGFYQFSKIVSVSLAVGGFATKMIGGVTGNEELYNLGEHIFKVPAVYYLGTFFGERAQLKKNSNLEDSLK